jgi:hypothetical protein
VPSAGKTSRLNRVHQIRQAAPLAVTTARRPQVQKFETVFPGSAADLGKLVAEETEKWGKVVKFSGAKPE